MANEIIYIDRSKILPGKLPAVKRAISDLVEFIEEREPQLLSYGFFLDEEASRMTVVAVHPDAASVELHMEVGGEAFRGFSELIEMEAIEVYGELSARAHEQLRAKAEALGDEGRVAVVSAYDGFSRLEAWAPTTSDT